MTIFPRIQTPSYRCSWRSTGTDLLAVVAISAALLSTGCLATSTTAAPSTERVTAQPITARHRGITREAAADSPKHENDQVVVDGWPMYRTERGQEAFNHAMATLAATRTRPADLSNDYFARCKDLQCPLDLPRLTRAGWIPAGRLWVAPDAYILVVHSPRRSKYDPGRRRSANSMRYFVFHEFHNATGNVDVFDTISAHRSSVFVPFYLSKPGRDADGNRYVVMVQVAPHDIVSRHARAFGNRGPGIEVANNRSGRVAPLQHKAGILVATIVKRAVPRLRVVRHRGREGLPMLRAYQRRLANLKHTRTKRRLKLPFVAAPGKQLPRTRQNLAALITHRGPAKTRPAATPPATLRASFAAIPKLITSPRLVHAMTRPVTTTALTMERLVKRVLAGAPLIAPAPKPVCRRNPDQICP